MEILARVEEVARNKWCNMADLILSKGTWPIVGLNNEVRIESVVKALEVKP